MNEDLQRAIEIDRKKLEVLTLDELDWEYFKRFKEHGIGEGRDYMVGRLVESRWKNALEEATTDDSPSRT